MTDGALERAIRRARAGLGSPRLSDSTFVALRGVVARASGISFGEDSRFILERRLLPRLRALRLDDFEAYYRYLLYARDAGAELARMLEAVTIRETYFFREPGQMALLRDELLPRLAEENAASRRLRLWSAGCASGEEPYSVAMLALESGLFDGWRVDIFGTDLVPKAIAEARRGRYREASLRETSGELRDRYFEPAGGDEWRLAERVRRMVTFGVLNLVETARYAVLPRLDAILCRNVLIYFAESARRLVVDAFHERLREGGYLMLGHAESLVALNSPFSPCHFERDLVYRR